MNFYLFGFGKGRCRAACQEDIQAIMAFTGWSQDTVIAIFFLGLFFILLLIVFVLYTFRPKRYRYRSKYKQKK